MRNVRNERSAFASNCSDEFRSNQILEATTFESN